MVDRAADFVPWHDLIARQRYRIYLLLLLILLLGSKMGGEEVRKQEIFSFASHIRGFLMLFSSSSSSWFENGRRGSEKAGDFPLLFSYMAHF